ncbi:hypothetical protein ABIC78_002666 [Novosphingobium sp. 1529]|uniref:hypothetical protein n=1 Tax=Novosphingobium sp. 1529 TaxID=3156424 RepID=UPI003390FD72
MESHEATKTLRKDPSSCRRGFVGDFQGRAAWIERDKADWPIKTTRHRMADGSGELPLPPSNFVIPAQAGIQWLRAIETTPKLDSRLRGNDEEMD